VRQPRLLLRLEPRGETLSLRNSFNLQCDGIDGRFYSLESAIYRTQLPRWHWPGLEPSGDEPHEWQAKNHDHETRNYPGKDFVNYEVWIRRHLSLREKEVHLALRPRLARVSPVKATANDLHVTGVRNLAETSGGFT
jgi:hypothetical protein